jgi:hypothetical protein
VFSLYFFYAIRANNTVNTDVFGTLEAKKTVLTLFSGIGSRNQGAAPSKNSGIFLHSFQHGARRI